MVEEGLLEESLFADYNGTKDQDAVFFNPGADGIGSGDRLTGQVIAKVSS